LKALWASSGLLNIATWDFHADCSGKQTDQMMTRITAANDLHAHNVAVKLLAMLTWHTCRRGIPIILNCRAGFHKLFSVDSQLIRFVEV
jgi:hypothetical protein